MYMRIIRLSSDDEDMKDIDKLGEYFRDTLNGKTDGREKGEFRMKKINRVKGLCPGDWLVFSYRDKNKKGSPRIVYIANAEDGEIGTYKNKKGEECLLFRIDMDTLVEGNGKFLEELEERLKKEGLVEKLPLPYRHWNAIETDNEKAKAILQDFAAQPLGGSKNPLLVFNVAWMREYRGNEDGTDIPQGIIKYVVDHKKCGEMWNFLDKDNMYYGYGMTQGKGDGPGIDLARLISSKQKFEEGEEGNNIDVVFIARKDDKKRCVVGWYKNATVLHKHYNKQKKGREEYGYLCQATFDNVFRVEEEDRINIPTDVRVTFRNHLYANQEKYAEFRQWLMDYIRQYMEDARKVEGIVRAYNIDKEEISQIEDNAVEAVKKYYEQKGYEVDSVESENRGWDLEATKGGEILYIEVKGHKGPIIQFELTPNEYSKMQEYYQQYRVCIVCNALSDNRKLTETLPCEKNGEWFLQEVESGKIVVQLKEKTAAVAELI